MSPRSDAPSELVPGAMLSALVDVATGLTPPPGIQEDRALRLFAITLCADGIDLGGGARRCFPLAVRNVRPLDGSSLRYRVEAPVPVWVAPWVYDLVLRFPGGQIAVSRAVIVREQAGAPRAGSSLLRVHVGPSGLSLSGASFRGFPLPDGARGFDPGFVALVQPSGNEALSMTKRQAEAPFPLVFRSAPAEAGRPVLLQASGFPAGSRVFWWLDPARGALGSDVTTVFLLRGRAPLELLAVAPDGRFARRQAVLPIWQRRAFGCSLSALAGSAPRSGSSENCFILFAIGWCCVRRSRSGARFAIRP